MRGREPPGFSPFFSMNFRPGHRRPPVSAAVLSPPQSCHHRSPVTTAVRYPPGGGPFLHTRQTPARESGTGTSWRAIGQGLAGCLAPHHGLAGGWEPPKRYLGTGGEMIPPSTPTSFELAFSGTMFSGQLIHLEAFVDDVLKDSCFRFRTIRNVFLSGCNN